MSPNYIPAVDRKKCFCLKEGHTNTSPFALDYLNQSVLSLRKISIYCVNMPCTVCIDVLLLLFIRLSKQIFKRLGVMFNSDLTKEMRIWPFRFVCF